MHQKSEIYGVEQAISRRAEQFLGDKTMECIAQKRVIIFGFMLAGLVLQDINKKG